MFQRKTKLFSLLILLLFIAAGAVWYFDQGPVVWERTSYQRFEANQSRLKTGAVAYNLLCITWLCSV